MSWFSALALVSGALLVSAALVPLYRRGEKRRRELERMRRRLERAERLAIAGELAAKVAHEIKNPLAPIRGYAQLLASYLEDVAPERRELFAKGLAIIQSEVDRIDARLAALLGAAREREPMHDGAVELNPVVLDALAVAEGDARAVELVPRLDPEVGVVRGDAEALRGVFLNLIQNALEAMEGRAGRIEVVTRVEAERAVVEVLDEGPGLAPEHAEHLFQPFYTTKPTGTGLGLAISRSAVEAAGGTLTLESRAARGDVARARAAPPDALKSGAVARVELERLVRGERG